MSDATDGDDRSLRRTVATACRILALHGFEDLTLGHVSVRGDEPRTVHIKRKGPALGEVRAEDVLPLDLDDEHALLAPEMHLEAVLHTEIYRIRPDVGAVIHSHPWYSTALAGTTAGLEMLTHDAVLFNDGLPVFSETSDMITEPAQGKAVARCLGDSRAVLLRNHGVVVVGTDVPWAVLTALTLERSARMQFLAGRFGPANPIDPESLDEVFANKYQEHFLDEYWAYWCRKVELAESSGRLPSP